jgi:hypothetical protein
MGDTLPLPLFVPAADNLHNLSGEEAVSRLLLGEFHLFSQQNSRKHRRRRTNHPLSLPAVSRCKKFVSDGRRIENISWRIWFHDYHHPANPSQGEIHIFGGRMAPKALSGRSPFHKMLLRYVRKPPQSHLKRTMSNPLPKSSHSSLHRHLREASPRSRGVWEQSPQTSSMQLDSL